MMEPEFSESFTMQSRQKRFNLDFCASGNWCWRNYEKRNKDKGKITIL